MRISDWSSDVCSSDLGDGVVVGVGLHALGRHDHQVVAEGRSGDVQLGTADHDAVGAAVDHPDVGVGIALAGGIDAAIALGVGDALGDADVGLLGRLVVAVDGVGVAQIGRASCRDSVCPSV